MSKLLRITFAVHTVVALVIGSLLLIIPGRFLLAIGWAPIDPIISRLLGASLLGLAWGSFRGWRARDYAEVRLIVELEAVFAVMACVGVLRHLLVAKWPFMVWFLFIVLAVFAFLWVYSWVRYEAQRK